MSSQVNCLDDVTEIHDSLFRTFKSGKTLPIAYRRTQLLQFARMMQDNIIALQDAMYTDTGKHPIEIIVPEINPIIAAALHAVDMLETWTAPEKPKVNDWHSSFNITHHKVPKGVAAFITPWNFPLGISFLSMIGAIAAGCACLLKPSEYCPKTSYLLSELFSKYLDKDAFRVICGDESVSTSILSLRWDHIFFTGSTRVGKIVAASAAKFVTPCTLELGGKSPVYLDDDCDIKIAARRILWGKIHTSGQVCVSPDYVLVKRSVQNMFIQALKEVFSEFFPKGALHPDSGYARIISAKHALRLEDLLKNTKGELVFGGRFEGTKRLETAIVNNVPLDDILMEDEIFGPILPIIPVTDEDEAINIINTKPTALVVYVFTNKNSTKEKFLVKTESGNIVYNETFSQLGVPQLPLQGKGESGYGGYFDKTSFDTFTHVRGSMDVPYESESAFGYRYPPYTNQAYEFFSAVAKVQIPEA